MENMQIDLLKKIVNDMDFIKKELFGIKEEIEDLKDIELEVRPEYLKKLKEIEKGEFLSRKEFEKEMAQ